MDLPAGAELYDVYRLRGRIREYGIQPLFIRHPELMQLMMMRAH
ncbi:hypothetical protein [Paenibacillus profundus]|nr:hypothetical protein [Paenibacillus profundus]